MKAITEVLNSPIHGRGLFAVDALKKNTCIGVYTGKIITESAPDDPDECIFDTHCVDFALNAKETVVGNSRTLIFVNHAKRPNCIARFYQRKIRFYTTRPVAAGAELTLDYHCKCRKCSR